MSSVVSRTHSQSAWTGWRIPPQRLGSNRDWSLFLVSIETKGRKSRLQSRLKPKSTPGEISEMSGREVSRDLIGVNRRYELTPPQSIISMFYRADRGRDPTPAVSR
jgi:hypothetical protein